MDLGFETIGNACLICHDKGPVLATDPWIKGSAYFGSWTTSHVIPEEQLAHVKACKYLWISHGHPDHLSPESLEELRDKEILLPDHFGHFGVHGGGRIARDLRHRGTACGSSRTACGHGSPSACACSIGDMPGRDPAGARRALDPTMPATTAPALRARHREPVPGVVPPVPPGYGDADMIHFFDERTLPRRRR
jgi:hypothetical protein